MAKAPKSIISNADQLEEHPLSPEIFQTIGKIAVLGAEIDDLLSSLVFRSTKTNPADGYLMLGKTSIGTKVKMLDYLVKKYETKKMNEMFSTFKSVLLKFSSCRNFVCHGIYMGRLADNGGLCFLKTSDLYEPESGNTLQQTALYSEDYLAKVAEYGEMLTAAFSDLLEATSARDIHLARLRKGPSPEKASPRY